MKDVNDLLHKISVSAENRISSKVETAGLTDGALCKEGFFVYRSVVDRPRIEWSPEK